MGVASNTNGYLRRTTNVPVSGTGMTQCAWVRLTGNAPSPYAQLAGVGTASANQYIDIGVNGGGTAMILEKDGPGGYSSASMLTLTQGDWYFVALVILSSTTAKAMWRAQSDVALSTTGSFTVDNLTWTEWYWMGDSAPFRGPFECRAPKQWHAVLSDADILAESFQDAPIVTSGLDSFLPLAAGSSNKGDDVSSNNRDWTVLGTFSDIDIPSESTRRRARGMRDESAEGAALARRLMPLASFSPSVDSPPGPRRLLVRDSQVGELPPPARRKMPLAVVAAATAVLPAGLRGRARELDVATVREVVQSDPPMRRLLSLAAAFAPPPPPPVASTRRRLDVRRNRARFR